MSSPGKTLPRLIAEARRRRVIPVAAMYVIAAWAILQGADILFPAWGIPDQAMQFVVYAVLLGFPIALLFGWRYDLTADGITLTPAADGDQSVSGSILSRYDKLLLGLMVIGGVAIGAWLLDNLVMDKPPDLVGEPNSVAVLAFDGDGTGDNKIPFELANQIVTTLITIPGLRVTGRESSFYFSDRATTLEQISRLLNTRHLLTGQVHQTGDQLDISVQLLRMPGETAVWAQTFRTAADRSQEIFSAIGQQVAGALQVNIADTAHLNQPDSPSTSPEVLRLEKLAIRAHESTDFERAISLVESALAIDPDYAHGYLTRANAYLWSFSHNGRPERLVMLKAVADSLDRADQLGVRQDAEYYYLRGMQARRLIATWGSSPALEKTLEENFDKAIALNPSDAQPYVAYSIYFRRMRRYNDSARLLETALDYDPLHFGALIQYSRSLSALGRREEAFEHAIRVTELHGRGQIYVANRYSEFQQLDKSMQWLLISTDNPKNRQRAMADTWASLLAPKRAAAILQDLAGDNAYGLMALSDLAAIEGDFERAFRNLADRFDLDGPDDGLDPVMLEYAGGLALRAGFPQQAVHYIERAVPKLRNLVAPSVTEQNVNAALNLACALGELEGNQVRVGILISQILNLVRDRPVIGFDGVGSLPAEAYACQGDPGKAVAAFQVAYDAGLRNVYRWSEQLPYPLESLRGQPQFDQLLEAIKDDLDAMRERAETPLTPS